MSKLLTPNEALEAMRAGKKVEYKPMGFDWTLIAPSQISIACLLNDGYQFRVRQERITIGNVSFPKPETKAPKEGQGYFMPDPTTAKLCFCSQWHNVKVDEQRLERGVVHLTEENAIAHAKALIELSGGKL